MALLDANNTEFKESVTRTGLHFKSGRLKRLLNALTDVQKNPNDGAKLAYLFKRIHRWKQENPKEFAKRGARVDELLGEIRQRAQQLHVTLVVPSGDGGAPPARAFVERVRPALDAFKQYACADAFLGTPYNKTTNTYDYTKGFAGCIKHSARAEVERRNRELKGTTRGATSPFDSFIKAGAWNAKQYQTICGRVQSEQAGVCVTFAKAAAHILTNGQDDGPLVEIVAYKNHAYVLVNRQGEVGDNGYLPQEWINEPGVIIVDPWAASMGHECIYHGRGGYPFTGMIHPLLLVASWDDQED
jgi:hypothetical protein